MRFPRQNGIARLKERMRAAGVPVIYVNDNFGRWQSSFHEQIERCMNPQCRGIEVASLLVPDVEDYFILKPMHSGFYGTPLSVLLGFLGIKTLVLAGFAGDICVIYTANDAYMRNYQLVIGSDCIASESKAKSAAALSHMAERLKARVALSRAIW